MKVRRVQLSCMCRQPARTHEFLHRVASGFMLLHHRAMRVGSWQLAIRHLSPYVARIFIHYSYNI
jgi:hypothetical protein